MTADDTTTRPRPFADTTGDNDETNHMSCCDRNRALCGWDIADHPETEEGDICVVCFDLDVANVACGVVFCGLRRTWRQWRRR